MTEELTGISTRSIWLTVLRGGGRWNVVEIAAELDCSTDLVCRFINQLSTRGYMRRHKTQGKLMEYSVDKTCKIPQSLTMGEVMEGATGQ